MASPERIYQGSVRAVSFVLLAVGVMLLVTTLVSGGGPLSVGVLLGAAFLAVGSGRLWIASRT
jgi:predicted anti-sigma-YlaC factor YlaD